MDQRPNLRSHDGDISPLARVYVIVLNWNGWRDTIECLESVLHLDYPDYKVIVCDNASSDGSMEHIRSWARGDLAAEPKNPALASLVTPPVPKPVPFVELSPDHAAKIADVRDARLVLIQTGANLAFAGGNNVGLRYALQQGDCDFVWILNNDTVVQPGALSALVKHMRHNPEAGISGSKIFYYYQHESVQAFGGYTYDPWTARGRPVSERAALREQSTLKSVKGELSYVVGAAMLVSRTFLEKVGLMQEDYFLYFEELDWAIRAKGQFGLTYCPDSIVYHKEGGSLGSSSTARNRSSIAEYYWTRNRIRFTRRFYPYALPLVTAVICAALVSRLVAGMWTNAHAIFKGLVNLGWPEETRASQR